jgi:hypothetical protein
MNFGYCKPVWKLVKSFQRRIFEEKDERQSCRVAEDQVSG